MTFKTILAAAIASMVAIHAASANDAARFELRNNSGQAIDEIHVMPAWANGLGADLLGTRVLPAGNSVVVTPGASGCRYNVQVTYHDASTEWFHNIDLCQTTSISFANSRNYVQR